MNNRQEKSNLSMYYTKICEPMKDNRKKLNQTFTNWEFLGIRKGVLFVTIKMIPDTNEVLSAQL